MTIHDFVDIVAAGFDAGIWTTNLLAESMIMVPVGPKLGFAVVGSPAYLNRTGHPRSPADLQMHACIERRFPSGIAYPWVFVRDGETVEVARVGSWRCSAAAES